MADERRTLLLCEQDPSLRAALSEVLGREGFLVNAADSLKRAFRSGQAERLHMLVVDIDGDTAQELDTLSRLAELRPDIPILLLEDEAVRRARPAGLARAARLGKPFSLEDLRDSIRKAEARMAVVPLAREHSPGSDPSR